MLALVVEFYSVVLYRSTFRAGLEWGFEGERTIDCIFGSDDWSRRFRFLLVGRSSKFSPNFRP